MTNKDKAKLVADVIYCAALRNTSTHVDPVRIVEEMWSEGVTLAEHGDDRIWCQFIQAHQDSDYWYFRIKADVLRRYAEHCRFL